MWRKMVFVVGIAVIRDTSEGPHITILWGGVGAVLLGFTVLIDTSEGPH